MYNSFHTALSRGSGRIEDACGESPAASPFGYVLWVNFKLFVHYSFLLDLGATFGSPGSILGTLEAILGALEGLWGSLSFKSVTVD